MEFHLGNFKDKRVDAIEKEIDGFKFYMDKKIDNAIMAREPLIDEVVRRKLAENNAVHYAGELPSLKFLMTIIDAANRLGVEHMENRDLTGALFNMRDTGADFVVIVKDGKFFPEKLSEDKALIGTHGTIANGWDVEQMFSDELKEHHHHHHHPHFGEHECHCGEKEDEMVPPVEEPEEEVESVPSVPLFPARPTKPTEDKDCGCHEHHHGHHHRPDPRPYMPLDPSLAGERDIDLLFSRDEDFKPNHHKPCKPHTQAPSVDVDDIAVEDDDCCFHGSDSEDYNDYE